MKLEKPKYFLNKENGDMMVVYWEENIPQQYGWIEIAELCYNNLTKAIFGE